MILKYTYRTLITFTSQVSAHNFMLRCTPYPCSFQKSLTHTSSVIPHCLTAKSRDTFGNIVETGYVADMHDAFMFESAGVIDVSNIREPEEANPLFRYPSTLTEPDDAIRHAAAEIGPIGGNTQRWIADMADMLQQRFTYASGMTDVTTTASQALAQGHGVCQDYAHIAIALCREAGIAARYVNGFMTGEGATHAWIEYHDGTTWQAYDPTNNREVDDTYIKIAHGRDFNDCSINRGRFSGVTNQDIKVSLMVEQLKRYRQEQII